MPKHGITCPCRACGDKFSGKDMIWDDDKRRYVKRSSYYGGTSFSTQTKRGERIYGDESQEGKPGYKHGHDWESGYRTPHSSIGHKAVRGKLGTKDEHRRSR